MEKAIYENKPLAFEEVVSVGIRTSIMRFDIEETESGWECEESCFNHKEPLTENDYGKVVTFLVREKYSADDVEAIQQNYIESKTTEHKNEFTALREWRVQAKWMARQVLTIN